MRISTAKNVTPDSSPPIPREKREQFVWVGLAPRLIDPTKLAIIETLLRLEQPLAAEDLGAMIETSLDLARYHCRVLVQAGVLEVIDLRFRAGQLTDEPVFDFPSKSPEQAPAPTGVA
jgi:hypothetical protein